ncbi:MAG: FmdB family zinc ribbon protein [Phototrophicaceae bacterium]
MPTYDFHCRHCGNPISLTYKSIRDYSADTPTCPTCGSTELTRIITGVTLAKPSHQHPYNTMNANQMLSVFESGDSRAVGEMMRQVGESAPAGALGGDYHEATQSLLGGQSLNSVERNLQQKASSPKDAE